MRAFVIPLTWYVLAAVWNAVHVEVLAVELAEDLVEDPQRHVQVRHLLRQVPRVALVVRQTEARAHRIVEDCSKKHGDFVFCEILIFRVYEWVHLLTQATSC